MTEIRQVKFNYNGLFYVTLFGCGGELEEARLPGSNVAKMSTFLLNKVLGGYYTVVTGYTVNAMPVVEDAAVTKDGEMFYVSGMVDVDGVKVPVQVTDKELYVEYPAELRSVEVKNTEQEAVKEPEPVEVKKPESVSIPTVEVKEPESISITTVEVPEEHEEQPTVEEQISEIETGTTGITEQQVVEKETVKSEEKAEDFIARPKHSGLTIGGKSNNSSGFMVGNQMYKNNKTPEPVKRQPGIQSSIDRPPMRRSIEVPTSDSELRKRSNREVQPRHENSSRSTRRFVMNDPETTEPKSGYNQAMAELEAWRQKITTVPGYSYEHPIVEEKRTEPVPVPESVISDPVGVETIPEDTADIVDSEDEAFLESLNIAGENDQKVSDVHTEEAEEQSTGRVQEVLGRMSKSIAETFPTMPISILGNIPEFTMKDIDTSRLEGEGHVYCIDNRWHKCGEWFCIDVVNKASRFFYNSKTKSYFEVSRRDCLDYFEAVK